MQETYISWTNMPGERKESLKNNFVFLGPSISRKNKYHEKRFYMCHPLANAVFFDPGKIELLCSWLHVHHESQISVSFWTGDKHNKVKLPIL